jgi:hypothetical protein
MTELEASLIRTQGALVEAIDAMGRVLHAVRVEQGEIPFAHNVRLSPSELAMCQRQLEDMCRKFAWGAW